MSTGKLDRRDVVSTLLANRGDAVVVTGLGSSTYDVYATSHSPRNFYLWGAMGSAAIMGLGLATAQPDLPVIVVTGDGEMLMGMGALATIGVSAPDNLSIVVLDNEHYGETGMQQSHTSFSTDLTEVARANGITECGTVVDDSGLKALASRIYTGTGTCFYTVKIDASDQPKALPTRDGVDIKNEFRRAVLGAA